MTVDRATEWRYRQDRRHIQDARAVIVHCRLYKEYTRWYLVQQSLCLVHIAHMLVRHQCPCTRLLRSPHMWMRQTMLVRVREHSWHIE